MNEYLRCELVIIDGHGQVHRLDVTKFESHSAEVSVQGDKEKLLRRLNLVMICMTMAANEEQLKPLAKTEIEADEQAYKDSMKVIS